MLVIKNLYSLRYIVGNVFSGKLMHNEQ